MVWPFGPSRGSSPDLESQAHVQAVLNELLVYASDDAQTHLLEQARTHYRKTVAQIFEDDVRYIDRMNTFLEWFVFDYRIDDSQGHTIFDDYIHQRREELTQEDMVLRMVLSRNLHSLFQVRKREEGFIKVKDIVTGKRYWVTADDNLEKGDLMERRIVTYNNSSFFTYTHCLHPRSVLKLVKRKLKTFRKAGITPEFFLRLQSKQLTWSRSRQLSPENIYRFD